MYNDIIADNGMVVNSDIRMNKTIFTNSYMIAKKNTRLQMRTLAYYCRIAYHFICITTIWYLTGMGKCNTVRADGLYFRFYRL